MYTILIKREAGAIWSVALRGRWCLFHLYTQLGTTLTTEGPWRWWGHAVQFCFRNSLRLLFLVVRERQTRPWARHHLRRLLTAIIRGHHGPSGLRAEAGIALLDLAEGAVVKASDHHID